MKALRGSGRWSPAIGILVLGVFASNSAVQGAPTGEKSSEAQQKRSAATDVGRRDAAMQQGAMTLGPGIPRAMNGKLPVLPPVVVDYRSDESTMARAAGVFIPVGGGVAALDCALDEECNDCNPCTEDRCVSGVCDNRPLTDTWEIAPDCDDGIYCNGNEVCIGGVCAPSSTPPCALLAPKVCDEARQECVDPCTGNAQCDDLLYCTDTDTCVKQCEGGSLHGQVCASDEACRSVGETYPRCVDTCTHTDIDCGVGGICREEVGAYACSTGRCCNYAVSPPTCTSTTHAACSYQWLGVNDCSTTPPRTCPQYGSGIIDGSTLNWEFPWTSTPGVVTVGPVSGLACDALYSVGDDYTLSMTDGFLRIEVLRLAGAVVAGPSARFAIELRDANGLLIEDVYYPTGANTTGGPAIRTVIFDPPLVIPKTGIISMSVMGFFGPGGRIAWLSTDNVDVGSNNNTTMYANGAIKTGNFLGQCTGGSRDGLWCDRGGTPIVSCPGGTCDDVDDVLAFEIIGTGTSEPWGACCNVDQGTCSHTLPWECTGEFKGVGTFCALCTDEQHFLNPCDGDEDCGGQTGACQDQVCNQTLAECLTDDDCTQPGEQCVNLATVCATQACCEPDGGCQQVVGMASTCPSGTTTLGFATSCDPNCCAQPLPRSGDDNCNLAGQNVTVINLLPVWGEVVNVTLTGNNSSATFDDYTEWCDSGIFNPDGDTKDPGWWHAFRLDDCAYVRLELCCTNPVLEPAWANLYTGCPCAEILQNVGVEPPIGIGEGTDGGARGLPFCEEDNLWQTFGPLPADTYYYPVYSAPDGSFGVVPGQVPPGGGDYQLNIYASRCPTSQCCYLACNEFSSNAGTICLSDEDCLGSDSRRACVPTCDMLHVLACQEKKGWWVPNIADCGPGVCDTGACCTGPGECVDEIGGQDVTKALCDQQFGVYYGAAACPAVEGDPNPCPVCEIEEPTLCLDDDDTYVYPTDSSRSEFVHRADDFIATDTLLANVCVWGSWIDVESAEARYDCACVGDTQENDCTPRVQDNFTVTVWADAGQKPGAMVGTSTATMARGITETYANFDVWVISLTLDVPIAGLEVGTTYWLEVLNNTVEQPADLCGWYWNANIAGGNDWSFATFADEVWDDVDADARDFSWCIDAGQPPGPETTPQGRCCYCDPLGDCGFGTLAVCLDAGGSWDRGGTCEPNTCPNTRPPGDVCAQGMLTASEGMNAFSTVCATTDGPNPLVCDGANSRFGKDIWFQHVAPKTDLVTISLCNNMGWDGIMAIYTNGTSTCACPTTSAGQIACNDESCVSSGGPPEITFNTTEGVCYVIRIGGWVAANGQLEDAAQTAGTFTISYGFVCPYDPPAPAVGDPTIPTRIRHLSFSAPGGETQPNAVRVKLTASTQFPGSVGKVWYVGQPRLVSEVAGKKDATPPTYWAAELQTTPYTTNWSTYPMVHVYGRGVAPNCTYEVALVPQSCEVLETSYSAPVLILTSKWGDTVGDGNSQPPQGTVNFVDISSAVDKFKNSSGAPQKSRIDVASGTACLVDQIVDFVDIPNVVDAFRGVAYSTACAP